MSDVRITREEMIQQLLDELERNTIALESDDPKKVLERRSRYIKAQLESLGINIEKVI